MRLLGFSDPALMVRPPRKRYYFYTPKWKISGLGWGVWAFRRTGLARELGHSDPGVRDLVPNMVALPPELFTLRASP